ncbi:hypothetical protein CFSAN004177_00015 [Escherichia coli]|nr:hypothetical protein CFSAN004177_00015 [Escherichia coli]
MRDIQMVLERWGHGRQVVTPGWTILRSLPDSKAFYHLPLNHVQPAAMMTDLSLKTVLHV